MKNCNTDGTKNPPYYTSQNMDLLMSPTTEEKQQLLFSRSQHISAWLRLWYDCLPVSRGRCAMLTVVGALAVFVLLRLTLLDTLMLNIQNLHVSSSAGLEQGSMWLTARIRRELDQPQPGPYALKTNGPADRSQNGQSCAVAAILGRNRTFLEAGAYNGEDLSNTLYLEREMGWTGVLVEPDPWNYWSLRKRNRRSKGLNACLAPDTVASDQTFKQSDTMGRLAAASEIAKRRGLFTRVRCYPLYAVLRAANLTRLDYLALDLEGLEMKVLQTLPWKSVQITLLQVEASHLDTTEIKSPSRGSSAHLGANPRNPNNNKNDVSVTKASDSKTQNHEVPEKTSRTLQSVQASTKRLFKGKPVKSWPKIESVLNGCLPTATTFQQVEVYTDSQLQLKNFLEEKGYSFLGVIGEDFMFARLDLLRNERV